MARHYYLGETAARKLSTLFKGVAGVGSVDGPAAAPVDDEEYPAPFHVQWSDAESSWIIWIPSGSITSDHGYEAELLSTLTGSTEYGDGWYLLDELSIGSSWTPIYLDCWGDKQSSSETAPTYYHAELVTELEQHQRLVERYVVRIADAKRNSTTGAIDVKQITVGALVLKGGSGGGSGEITASGTVVTSVDYITSTGDPDFAQHAYSIRIKRGTLVVNAGALSVVENAALTQFIATTPLTSEGGY